MVPNNGQDPQLTIDRFKDFILNYKEENSFIYRYVLNILRAFLILLRQKLLQQINLKKYYMDVDMDHLTAFDEELADELRNHPENLLTLVIPFILLTNAANSRAC